jgi:hypothetical protein
VGGCNPARKALPPARELAYLPGRDSNVTRQPKRRHGHEAQHDAHLGPDRSGARRASLWRRRAEEAADKKKDEKKAPAKAKAPEKKAPEPPAKAPDAKADDAKADDAKAGDAKAEEKKEAPK